MPNIVFGTARLHKISCRRDAVRLLEAISESGIDEYDTAPMYGLGYSEAILGRVLGRKNVKVNSKVGFIDWPLSEERRGLIRRQAVYKSVNLVRNWLLVERAIKRYFDDSLRRLRVDSINNIWIHEPPHSGCLLDVLVDVCSRLQQLGRVSHWGFAGGQSSYVLDLTDRFNCDIVQVGRLYDNCPRGRRVYLYGLARDYDIYAAESLGVRDFLIGALSWPKFSQKLAWFSSNSVSIDAG